MTRERSSDRRGGVFVDSIFAGMLFAASIASTFLLSMYTVQRLPVFVAATAIVCVAVALRRYSPPWSLGLAWAGSLLHMVSGFDVGFAQLGVLIVIASAAHYGSSVLLLLSGLSVVVGSALALIYLAVTNSVVAYLFTAGGELTGLAPYVALGTLVGSLLAIPWLIGLLARALRLNREGKRRALEAERREQTAREVAELEAARVALARDVHDIVGHSLAVIVAQSDSVRFRGAGEFDEVVASVRTIGDTARRALQDVRHVLESTQGPAAVPAPALDLDQLVEDVVAARPGAVLARGATGGLPPGERGVALYRATQELLTNALRHGDAGGPLRIRLDGDRTVTRVHVENAPAPDRAEDDRVGTGLDGARERLRRVGGDLTIDHSDGLFRAAVSVPSEEVMA